MRQLLVNILIFGGNENCVIDGLKLWDAFSVHMYDGRCGEVESKRRKDRALAIIERLLLAQGRLMTEFGLPLPENSITLDPNRAVEEFFFPTHANDSEVEEKIDISEFEGTKLNTGQNAFFKLALDAVSDPHYSNKLLFLSGDGGTGKTFLLNYILYTLRRSGKKVLATASTGIASTKYYAGGMTFHSAFKFGIYNEPGKIPMIPFDGFFGRRIIEADVVMLDEVSMK